jgi:hypothetical protein
MAENICPTCGCVIGDHGLEKDGVIYCGEPCTSGTQCECGCCSIAEEESGK